LPLIEARSELDKIQPGQTLEVVANCPSVEEDMKVLSRKEGVEIIRKWNEGNLFHFLIKKL
jgi:TusA-related sulfurtransferase